MRMDIQLFLVLGAVLLTDASCWRPSIISSIGRNRGFFPKRFVTWRPFSKIGHLDNSPFSHFNDFNIFDNFGLLDHSSFWENFSDVVPTRNRLDNNQMNCKTSTGIDTESEKSVENRDQDIDQWEQSKIDDWDREYEERKTAFEKRENKMRDQHRSQVEAEKDRIKKLEEFHQNKRLEKEKERREVDQEHSTHTRNTQERYSHEPLKQAKKNHVHFDTHKAPQSAQSDQRDDKMESRNTNKLNEKQEVPDRKIKNIRAFDENEPIIIASMKIPGHTSKDLSIKSLDGQVRVKGFKRDHTRKGGLVQTFDKTFPLPENIREKSIHATVDTRGNLEITGKRSNLPRERDDEPLIETVDEEQYLFETHQNDFLSDHSIVKSQHNQYFDSDSENDHTYSTYQYKDDDITIEVVE